MRLYPIISRHGDTEQVGHKGAVQSEVFSLGIRTQLKGQGCCKVPIHAPDLIKRARRSARSESRQRSWRRQADHHIALTSEPSTARHAGGLPDRRLGWSDSACCLPSPQVRPRNADFAMALTSSSLRSSPYIEVQTSLVMCKNKDVLDRRVVTDLCSRGVRWALSRTVGTVA
jgi:hypothetical protein